MVLNLNVTTNPSGCSASNGFYLQVVDDRTKRLFTTLLAAHRSTQSKPASSSPAPSGLFAAGVPPVNANSEKVRRSDRVMASLRCSTRLGSPDRRLVRTSDSRSPLETGVSTLFISPWPRMEGWRAVSDRARRPVRLNRASLGGNDPVSLSADVSSCSLLWH